MCVVLGTLASKRPILALGNHIVRIKCTSIEIARLQGLLAFATILSFVDGVITSSSPSRNVSKQIRVRHRISHSGLVNCPVFVPTAISSNNDHSLIFQVGASPSIVSS